MDFKWHFFLMCVFSAGEDVFLVYFSPPHFIFESGFPQVWCMRYSLANLFYRCALLRVASHFNRIHSQLI